MSRMHQVARHLRISSMHTYIFNSRLLRMCYACVPCWLIGKKSCRVVALSWLACRRGIKPGLSLQNTEHIAASW